MSGDQFILLPSGGSDPATEQPITPVTATASHASRPANGAMPSPTHASPKGAQDTPPKGERGTPPKGAQGTPKSPKGGQGNAVAGDVVAVSATDQSVRAEVVTVKKTRTRECCTLL